VKSNELYRVLIVDDEPAIHETLRDMLTAAHEESPDAENISPDSSESVPSAPEFPQFQIDSAFNGEEAVRKVSQSMQDQKPYFMAFVDMRMPNGWDGLKTIRHIWNVYFELQIVICTGKTDLLWHDIIHHCGHTDRLLLLRKPFDQIEVRQFAYSLAEKWNLSNQAHSHLQRLQVLVHERTAKVQETNNSLQRKLVELKQAERRLTTQYAVSQALAESTTPEDALNRVFEIVCHFLNWDWSALWKVNPQKQLLQLKHCWSPHPEVLEKFRIKCQEFEIGVGDGLLGHVWDSAQPIWAHDLLQYEQSERSLLASENGLHGTAAFPIWVGHKILGVVEFMSGEIKEPDANLLQTFAVLGSAIGQFIERKQAELERSAMEIQLRQAHKLEAIGQLAAGIAHEINTPTQYIGDNVRFLQSSFDGIKVLHQHYAELLRGAKDSNFAPDLVRRIEEFHRDADIDFLLDETPKAIQQSLDGIGRVTKIVRAMKDFSHPGTGEKTLVDLNNIIETTITVTANEWKYVALIEKMLDPTLPLVLCLPGELHQALLNLVINAAQAISDVTQAGTKGKGRITITSKLAGSHAEICIQDTGTGIPEQVRPRIFDPFFTTKTIGRGTGQGLSIARSVVVDQHGGSLSFETQTGVGTAFKVLLPLQPVRRDDKK
jgi:signal transduction histidine kinase/DNA-binding response OmpR family regulator